MKRTSIDLLRDSWSIDVLANRDQVDGSLPFLMQSTTLYRRAKDCLFDLDLLPMKGIPKPSGYSEKEGKKSLCETLQNTIKTIRTGAFCPQ